jgi:hypothetical protein
VSEPSLALPEILADQARFELDARKTKIEQVLAAQAQAHERMAEIAAVDAARAERSVEALDLLQQLRVTGDAAAFASAMERWCRRPGWAFVGANGQMFLKQLVTAGIGGESSDLLANVLTCPKDESEATAKFARLLEFIARVKKGGHPAPARAPFLLSIFWAMHEPTLWPVAWPSAVRSLRYLGWLNRTNDLAQDYLSYAGLARTLGDPGEITHALYWFEKNRFVGLSPHLTERCTRGRHLAKLVDDDGQYLDPRVRKVSEQNTTAMTYELWHAVTGLSSDIAATLRFSQRIRAEAFR